MRRHRSTMVWCWLHFDQSITTPQTHDVLTGLAVAPLAPVVALDVIATDGTVRWRIGIAPAALATVTAIVQAHLPGVRLERHQATEMARPTLTAALHLLGQRTTPLKGESAEAVTTALYAQLAATRSGESIHIQVVIGQRFAPGRRHSGEPSGAALVRHTGEHGMRVALHVGVHASTAPRARELVRGVGAAWRGLEVPGCRVELWRTRTRSLTSVRPPWWGLQLRVDDLALLLGWPLADGLPGTPAVHPRLLAPEHTRQSGWRLGVATSDSATPIRLSVADSLHHLHVLGPTGVGKSTLLAHLGLQAAWQGGGLVVIDPKGDLVTDILARLPLSRLSDVVVVDPTATHVVGIDALGSTTPDLAADVVLSVFSSLYADSWGPRTHDILHASLLTLARAGGLPLALLPSLLTHDSFRAQVVRPAVAADQLGVGAFWGWYEAQTPAARAQAIAPLMNKLRPLLMRPGIRATFGQRHLRFGLSDVFTRRRILLVSLAKGTLGPDAAQLLGSIIVALLWQASLQRISIPAERRHPVMVIIDEVQDYLRLPGSLSDALAQARGLGVGFTLAHQYLDQLPAGLRAGLASNARSTVWFSLSAPDARTIAATTSGLLTPDDFTSLPAFHAYARLLYHASQEPPVSLTTEPLGPRLRDPHQLAESSAAIYGQSITATDADLLHLIDTTRPPPPSDQPTTPAPPTGESFGRRRRTRPRTPPKGEHP